MKKVLLVLLCVVLLCGAFVGCTSVTNDTVTPSADITEGATIEPEPIVSEENTEEAKNAEPTPSEATVSEEMVHEFDITSVQERFSNFFTYLDGTVLGNDTTVISAILAMGLEEVENIPNTYKFSLPIYDSYIYFLTDDTGDVISGLILTAQDAYDQYKGKRQTFALSYALAPSDTFEGELVSDRLTKIDELDPANTDFALFGDVMKDETAMISSSQVEGYIAYFGLRMNYSEEVQNQAISWSADAIKEQVVHDADVDVAIDEALSE